MLDTLDRRFAGRLSFLLGESGVHRTMEEILGWEWDHTTWQLFIKLDDEMADVEVLENREKELVAALAGIQTALKWARRVANAHRLPIEDIP